jgi:hypothetical protein
MADSPTGPGAYRQRAGIGNEASYVVSGKPFALAAQSAAVATKIAFPTVTRFVTIINHHATQDLKCGFSENGLAGSNHFVLESAGSTDAAPRQITLEIKVTEMWFETSTNFDVIAGLTGISTDEILNNWSGSVGVG